MLNRRANSENAPGESRYALRPRNGLRSRDSKTTEVVKPTATRGRRALGDISNKVSTARAGDKTSKPGLRSRVTKPKTRKRAAAEAEEGENQAPSRPTRSKRANSSVSTIEAPPQKRARKARVDTSDLEIDEPASFAEVEPSTELTFEPLQPCDIEDENDPQALSYAVNDVFAYMKKTEHLRAPSHKYMIRQRDLNPKMRTILVDWLVQIHHRFHLHLETMYLTVNIIDRFLERRTVSRSKLQLVGCAAILLAAKYEEIYAPEVNDLVYISDYAYTREQILKMEGIILNALQFQLTVPSPLKFSRRLMRLTPLYRDRTLHYYVRFLMELTLQEYSFLHFLPSMIASAAVFLATRALSEDLEDDGWSQQLADYTQYSLLDLSACATELYWLSVRNPEKHKAVRRKYRPLISEIDANAAWHRMFGEDPAAVEDEEAVST